MVYSNISGVVFKVVKHAENCPEGEIYFAYSLSFSWKIVRIKMAITPVNVWNHWKILERCCLVLFVWGLWIVFRLSPLLSPNIVFLLGWEGWKFHRLNNRPFNVVSWIDYSPSSYNLDPFAKSPQLLMWQFTKRLDPMRIYRLSSSHNVFFRGRFFLSDT